jgi:hypothetical protein
VQKNCLLQKKKGLTYSFSRNAHIDHMNTYSEGIFLLQNWARKKIISDPNWWVCIAGIIQHQERVLLSLEYVGGTCTCLN